MIEREKSFFLLEDIKKIKKPKYFEENRDAKKEFAMQCAKHTDALPFSRLAVYNSFKPNMLAIIGTHLTPD